MKADLGVLIDVKRKKCSHSYIRKYINIKMYESQSKIYKFYHTFIEINLSDLFHNTSCLYIIHIYIYIYTYMHISVFS